MKKQLKYAYVCIFLIFLITSFIYIKDYVDRDFFYNAIQILIALLSLVYGYQLYLNQNISERDLEKIVVIFSSPINRKIIKFLNRNPQKSISEISKKINSSKSTVLRCSIILCNEEIIEKNAILIKNTNKAVTAYQMSTGSKNIIKRIKHAL